MAGWVGWRPETLETNMIRGSCSNCCCGCCCELLLLIPPLPSARPVLVLVLVLLIVQVLANSACVSFGILPLVFERSLRPRCHRGRQMSGDSVALHVLRGERPQARLYGWLRRPGFHARVELGEVCQGYVCLRLSAALRDSREARLWGRV